MYLPIYALSISTWTLAAFWYHPLLLAFIFQYNYLVKFFTSSLFCIGYHTFLYENDNNLDNTKLCWEPNTIEGSNRIR